MEFTVIINFLVKKGIALFLLLVSFIFVERIVLHQLKLQWKKYVTKRQLSEQRALTLYKVFISLLHYTLYFVTIYTALSIIGIPVSTLLAGAGVAGLIIGLGMQGFIHDCVSGLFILIEKQFDVNDHVRISQIEGIVKSIGLRITTITGLDGTLYFIRNRDISVVNNLSLGKRRVLVNIFIKSADKLDEILQIIQSVNETNYSKYAELLQAPDILGLQTAPNGQLYISVWLYVKSEQAPNMQHTFYKDYIHALQERNIAIL